MPDPWEVPQGDHASPDEARQDRPPTRDDCPHNERQQSERSNDTEGFPGSTRRRALRQQDVRNEEHNPRDGDASMPDRRSIDSVEPHLHPRQGADQDKRDREEKDRLGAAELSDVAGASLARRPEREPDRSPGGHEGDDGRRTGLARGGRAGKRHATNIARERPRSHGPRSGPHLSSRAAAPYRGVAVPLRADTGISRWRCRTAATARTVAAELTARRSLGAHLDAELHIDPADIPSPIQVKIGPRALVAPATPMTMPAAETIPSLAPSTPARSQFNRPAVPPDAALTGQSPVRSPPPRPAAEGTASSGLMGACGHG